MKFPRTAGSDPGAQAEPSTGSSITESWSPFTRALFRFCIVYFGLFMLATQVAGGLIPGIGFRGIGPLWPMREITIFVATDVLGLARPQVPVGVSAETTFFWVQTGWILVLALVATIFWTRLDRRRRHYSAAHQWFRLAVRIGLAAQMFEYGLTKVIPTQFPAPSLVTLVTPVGDLSLSASLWTTIGAAPGYEVFTGCVELIGGILLLIPQTTLAGALLCLANLVHVLALNMTFDIGLKLTTFHLVLLSVVLLAPDFRRLANVLIHDRPTTASPPTLLFASARANHIVLLAPVVFGVCLIGSQTYLNAAYWYAIGGGAPRSMLYGIWDVEELAVDGESGPVATYDYDRQWRRVIFDAPGELVVQRIDDSFARYLARIDLAGSRIQLTRSGSRTWGAQLEFARPSEDRLTISGRVDDHQMSARLVRVELDTFRLLNSHFRWTQPPPQ